ncbi:hypothetical protein VNI00_007611 [Paramarasmius palmivorus]|uniref:HNH nuclease domain-containing protein n=1 Tax=Paramarasmius palmivorus TaxID=297713 RepID=A0AAW0D2B6_9AGAR
MPHADLQTGPLPNPNETLISCADHVKNAYVKVFQVQQRSQNPEERLYARIVGYFLINLDRFRRTLGDKPINYISEEINQQVEGQSDKTTKLGSLFLQLILGAHHSWTTPNASPYSTPPSPNEQKDVFADIHESGKDPRILEKQVLVRDGFRCLVNSMVNESYGLRSDSLLASVKAGRDLGMITKCCRIFCSSGDEDTREITASVLSHFGITDKDSVATTIFHDIRNALTLTLGCRFYFNELETWFEPTCTKHEYIIFHASTWRQPSLRAHDAVTLNIQDSFFATTTSFTEMMKSNPDQYLPDPKLLVLHATCARVAHMSGVADLLLKSLPDFDFESWDVLAPDGSDTDRLTDATSKLSLYDSGRPSGKAKLDAFLYSVTRLEI